MSMPEFEICLMGSVSSLKIYVVSADHGLRLLCPMVHPDNILTVSRYFLDGKGFITTYPDRQGRLIGKAGVAFSSDSHILTNQAMPSLDEVQVFSCQLEEVDCVLIKRLWYAVFLCVFCRLLGLRQAQVDLETWLQPYWNSTGLAIVCERGHP